MQGYPIGSIVVHRYGGLDEFGEPTFMKKGDDTKYHYSELNSLELEDLEYMGSSNPPFSVVFPACCVIENFH